MTRFSLLSLLLIFGSLNQATSEVYYITTNSNDHYTIKPRLTLSQFATNSSHYLHSNTTLVFLPGTHYLSTVLTLSNVGNFVLKSEHSTAQIKCTSYSHFYFNQSQCVYITNLELVGCGGNQVKYVKKIVIKDTKFKGEENSGTALELTETTAQIVNSTFMSNRKGSYRKCKAYANILYGREVISIVANIFVGGAIIANGSVVNISKSRFEDNGADIGGAIFAEHHCIIKLNKTIFVNNNAKQPGGVLSSTLRRADEASDCYNLNHVKFIGSSVIIIINASKLYNNSAAA